MALLWTWSGNETKPTFELISLILGAVCCCSLLVELFSDSLSRRFSNNFDLIEEVWLVE